MKKHLLSGLALFFAAFASFGQSFQVPLAPKSVDQPQVFDKVNYTGDEPGVARKLNKKPLPKPASANGTQIGTTIYDLQSNASVDNRLILNPDGSLSAAWTYSATNGPAYTDRGTGYNYFNGTIWSTFPSARIESERVGWPSVVVTGSGKEVIITHSTATDVLWQASRTAKGAGAWTQGTSSSLNLIWPRAVIGGANNNTIHLIVITAPVANDGTIYQGLDGALLYFRSTNGGTSWDIPGVILQGLTSTDWNGFSGDQYAITADGDNIAFGIFNSFQDVVMFKSTDNGDTWNKRIMVDFPITKYQTDQGIDVDNDNIPDTVRTSDNSGSLIIDNNGKVHAFFGEMRRLDADLTDGQSSFFPVTNGLKYWNEDMADDAPIIITGAEDINQNGGIDIVGNSTAGVATYFLSLSSMPSTGKAANGDLYLSYSAFMENSDDGNQNYRHIFMMKTADNGCTWSTPVDVTNLGVSFEECVFGSMAPMVNDKVHMIYQEDNFPGLAVRGDEDPDGSNEIVYIGQDTSTLSTAAFSCPVYVDGVTELCPGDTITVEAACGSTYTWKNSGGQTLGTNQSFEVTANGTYTVEIGTACGIETVEFDIDATAPGAGAGPNFALSSNYDTVCVGDPVVLTATGALTGTTGGYDWGQGFTTNNSFTANGPGTYVVTVTNCVNDNSIDSITIAALTGVDAAIGGNAFICPGGNTMLTARDYNNATYSWSDGTNTLGASKDINVTATGRYFVTITACGFSDTASIPVQLEPIPNGTVQTTGSLEICEGGLVSLGSVSNVDSIVWSNGLVAATIPLTQASQTGDYWFVAHNNCGDSFNSDTVAETINAKPATQVIQLNSGVYTSNVGTNIQWYVNGNPVAGANAQTFIPPTPGQLISAKQIDPTTTCESDFSNVIQDPVGVQEMIESQQFAIYPNPNSGKFELALKGMGEVEVNITNAIGQVVFSEVSNVNSELTMNLNLSDSPKGMYFVNIEGAGIKTTQKVLIK